MFDSGFRPVRSLNTGITCNKKIIAMEITFRSCRLINRLLRKPLALTSYRSVVNVAAKDEVNTELLTSFNKDIQDGKLFRSP